MTEMVPIIPLPPAPPALNFGGNNFDCWVMVGGFNLSTANVATAMLGLPKFADALDAQFKLDKSLGNPGANFMVINGERFVVSPTGPLDRCEDDVRRFFDAAEAGIKRALKSGAKSPLLLVVPDETYEQSLLVSILGAMHALYTTLELREAKGAAATKATSLGVWSTCGKQMAVVPKASIIENAKCAYRDILGSDPERMAPKKVEEYCRNIFKDTCIKMNVVEGYETLVKEYPCLAAVDRCANQVERHRGRAIWLEYDSGDAERTICLVGKGVTYDTGGADIKAGGHMAGMHRDKGGAAAVASFMLAISKLQPKKTKVVAGMAMVRNSVGSEAYLADEIITSRAGKRVRVGNTDAEGRMAMVDLLCHVKEKCISENFPNPEIYTIATLTGHACLAVGDYTAIVPNGPYRKEKLHLALQEAGEIIGDQFDCSTLRREDYEFHMGKDEQSDVLQCNNKPSSQTARGHQTPAAFMILTSGMKDHGLGSQKPLKYAHLDIAGSSGPFPGLPTGAPVMALLQNYFF